MSNTIPSSTFVSIVKLITNTSKGSVRIAEIGVDRGSTTKKVLCFLRPGDVYDLFDRYDCTFFKEKHQIYIPDGITINLHGNTRKTRDSYAWNIAMIFLDAKKNNLELFDAVYLDGAHTFDIDAPSTCLLKEMIKHNGYIIFDDMKWTLFKSSTCNTPKTHSRYTDEQIKTPHVEMIVECFMRPDSRFTEITKYGESRAIFMKTS